MGENKLRSSEISNGRRNSVTVHMDIYLLKCSEETEENQDKIHTHET
jgi:hypothetical protein